MPCGGIQPTHLSIVRTVVKVNDPCMCWQCGKPGAKHFIEEWDDFIHARCAIIFLTSPEGQVIVDHGHSIYLDFSLEHPS